MRTSALDTVAVDTYRDAVSLHAAGVAVVTSVADDEPVGLTVSTFASHSVSPPTISCDLAASSRTLLAIRGARRFAVHLLASDQEEIARRFATRRIDRFAGLDWRYRDGLPALPGVVARFGCDLLTDVEVGDHAVVLGTVTSTDTHPDRRPLVHQARRFHSVG